MMGDDKKSTHSRELLIAEANMSSAPAVLKLKESKKAPTSDRKTFKLPPSSVLQRARQFLPMMARANTEVEQQLEVLPPGALDIENTDDHLGPLIEMNIALVDRQDAPDSSDSSDIDSSGESGDENAPTDGSTGDDNTPTDGSTHQNTTNAKNSDKPLFGEVTPDNMKLPDWGRSRRTPPKIEVISGNSTEHDGSVSETVAQEFINTSQSCEQMNECV